MNGRELYLRARRLGRAVILKVPGLDVAIGKRLVRFDLWLRRRGLVRVLDPSVREVELGGFRFGFDERNRDLAESIHSTREYEAETLDAIRSSLRSGGTFVDLGANIGFYAVQVAAAIGPSGRVYAFEPTPTTAAVLRQNLERNGVAERVTVAEAAVSSAPGRARFAIFGSAQANSLAVAGDESSADMIDVDVVSLDSYFAARGWPPVDVIKIDVEGQEHEVFRGMHELVRRNPRVRVIFEYHRGQLARMKMHGTELIGAARAAGFDSFAALFRKPRPLELPAELPVLERLATRANINVLGWRR